jgi:hypothetical protein
MSSSGGKVVLLPIPFTDLCRAVSFRSAQLPRLAGTRVAGGGGSQRDTHDLELNSFSVVRPGPWSVVRGLSGGSAGSVDGGRWMVRRWDGRTVGR